MALDVLKAYWPTQRLDEITPEMIDVFSAKRQEYRSASTVHKELQILKRMLGKAVEWNRLRKNPADKTEFPTVDNARTRHLAPEELLRPFIKAYVRACKKAGINDYTFHDLRHQSASDLAARGADINDISRYLRHANIRMTQRYTHLTEKRRKHTANLLDRPVAQIWPQPNEQPS